MESKRPFKVIIVGGGVGGLVLANMLERFGIDYVLLEARDAIHPPQGSAVGIMPNGSYIIDQLGLYEKLRASISGSEIEHSHFRNQQGNSILNLKYIWYHQERRHGYPILFFDRQFFLKLMYEQVKHKEKIMVNSKIDRLEYVDGGARVTTKTGESYMGDIVIGADGIHSTMRNVLQKMSKRFDPTEEDRIPAYYKCSFGIAQDVPGWLLSEQCFTTGSGQSFLVVSGPGGRCYWFLFVKYPKPLYGKEIPRYTKEDEARFTEECRGIRIKENLTFGQIYDKRITSTLSPLHEVVFKQWWSDRVLLIGDSVHKPNPIGGMGGNAAIETAAEFINALIDVRQKRPNQNLDGLSQSEIEGIFKRVQDTRYERAQFTVSASHDLQAFIAMERPLLNYIAVHFLLPLAGNFNFFRELSDRIVGGSRLEHLSVPFRSRVIPFDHELPARPLQGIFAKVVRVIFFLAFIVLLYVAETTLRTPAVEDLVSRSTFLINLKPTPASLIASMLTPLLIFNIEGSRNGRKGSLLEVPLLFNLDTMTRGIGRSSIAYALIYALHSPLNTVDRAVPVESAKSLLPAVAMGFILPAFALLSSVPSSNDWQGWASTLVIAFHILLKVFRVMLVTRKPRDQDPEFHMEWYSTDDLSPLNMAYKLFFVIQAAAHIGSLVFCSSGMRFCFKAGIWSTLFSPEKLHSSVGSGLLSISAAAVGHSLYMIWELRNQGYITTFSGLKAALGLFLGSVIVGPSASWLAIYRWRENVLASLAAQGA
ncbi:FAD/NAD(P)-binding domain-containing protein [Xylaria nigripes]|nr:FAD/NAD(P)-binding domain-containing protein [Xylaria nigripes]